MKLSNRSSMATAKSLFLLKSIAFVVVVFVAIPSVHANWLVNWELSTFLEYSDNGRRSDGNEDSTIVLEPGGSITAVHTGPNFDAEIGASNQYRSHLDDEVGSNNNFDLDGLLNWKISPDLFEWVFEDHFSSELPIDIRSSPNESNTQDVNVFSTGPTFTPRIFALTNMIFEGLFIRTDAGESDSDSDRLQGRVGIQRLLNPSSSVSLNYEYEDTDYDENTIDPLVGNIDFDRENYYIEYLLEKPSLNISAQLGYTEIERDEGPNRKSDGNDSRISVNYILNSTSSLNITAYDEFSDTTSNSGRDRGLGGFNSIGVGGSTGINTGPSFGDLQTNVTGDTVDSEGFFIGFNKQFSRLETSIEYFQRDDDHDLVDLNDRDSNGGVVEFTLPVTSTLIFGLLGEFRTTDFDIGDREDDDTLVELTGSYFLRRNLRFESSAEYRDRDSNEVGNDFDEFLVRIGLIYTNF